MATYQLDITKEHCPMTFVKTKIELAKLKEGDLLEVLLAEGEPLDNVPRTSEEQGYTVLSIEPAGKAVHKVTIRK
ncbi:MAG: sulfurtransferase TusA family protein [Tannerella sp.]|jgi:TusA-related sulfurtransferase|nr:sulfurtransferase TusA family protein [Tannerella sp.]